MNHLQLFEQYIGQQPLILYHGTPYRFDAHEFKGATIFLSETPKFAYDYASIKANDMKMENGITVYKCELNANLFDAHNPEHITKLETLLPDYIRVRYPRGGSDDLEKAVVIEGLQGFDLIKGFDLDRIKVKENGKAFQYDGQTQIIIDIDKDYVYYMEQETFYRAWDSSGLGKEDFMIRATSHKNTEKVELADKKEECTETWIYFEANAVSDAIKTLGFDGYTALENGIITYAIFNLDTIKILGTL